MTEIVLHDIDEERLRTSAIVAERIKSSLGVSASIQLTTDRERALEGADFALTTINVGGYEPATVTDFEVPKRYGLRQTIGDTLGIGGIMRALRTIPVLMDIDADMLSLGMDSIVALSVVQAARRRGLALRGLDTWWMRSSYERKEAS